MDITKEDDFQFLTENALKNIAIKGRPYPVRDQKLIMQGEDEAYIREAILEREYMVNGPSIGNAPVEVINKSDERILRIPKTWDDVNDSVDNLIKHSIYGAAWADAHKVDAMEDELPIDEHKASGEDGDNYSEYRFLCRAEFTPDEEVMPDFLARWDAEEDDYREQLAQINNEESDKIKEYQDQLEAKVKELKTELNEAIQEVQKQYENEVREAHIEMLTAFLPIAEKWNTLYTKAKNDGEDFPWEAHTEYLTAKAGLLDAERKRKEEAQEGLENAIKEANDKYNQDYNTWKTWTEDVIYSVREYYAREKSALMVASNERFDKIITDCKDESKKVNEKYKNEDAEDWNQVQALYDQYKAEAEAKLNAEFGEIEWEWTIVTPGGYYDVKFHGEGDEDKFYEIRSELIAKESSAYKSYSDRSAQREKNKQEELAELYDLTPQTRMKFVGIMPMPKGDLYGKDAIMDATIRNIMVHYKPKSLIGMNIEDYLKEEEGKAEGEEGKEETGEKAEGEDVLSKREEEWEDAYIRKSFAEEWYSRALLYHHASTPVNRLFADLERLTCLEPTYVKLYQAFGEQKYPSSREGAEGDTIIIPKTEHTSCASGFQVSYQGSKDNKFYILYGRRLDAKRVEKITADIEIKCRIHTRSEG